MSDEWKAMLSPLLEVVRAAFRAVYMGDAAGLAKVAVPDPELATAVVDTPPPPYKVAELDRSIQEMDIRPIQDHCEAGVVNRVDFLCHFRGMLFPASVVQIGNEWKFDCRWWIAARKNDEEPQRVARAFIFAWMTHDAQTLARTTVSHPNLGYLLKGQAPPAGEWGQLEHVVESTIFSAARVGESFETPAGKRQVTVSDFADGRMMLFGLIASQPPAMPVPLVKTPSGWRVDASLYVETGMR